MSTFISINIVRLFRQTNHQNAKIEISIIYWTLKETLQSSLLYYCKRWDYIASLHFVKDVRDVF